MVFARGQSAARDDAKAVRDRQPRLENVDRAPEECTNASVQHADSSLHRHEP